MKVFILKLVLGLDVVDFSLKFFDLKVVLLYSNVIYKVCYVFMWEEILIYFSFRLTFVLDVITDF